MHGMKIKISSSNIDTRSNIIVGVTDEYKTDKKIPHIENSGDKGLKITTFWDATSSSLTKSVSNSAAEECYLHFQSRRWRQKFLPSSF
jgi:hypothetical protein